MITAFQSETPYDTAENSLPQTTGDCLQNQDKHSDNNVSQNQTSQSDSTNSIRENRDLNASLEQICWQLQKRIQNANDLEGFLRNLSNVWCRTLAADQVVAVIHNSKQNQKRCKTGAVSGMDSFDQSSPSLTQLESICDSHANSMETISWNLESANNNETCHLLSGFALANGFQSAFLLPVADLTASEPSVILHLVVFANSPRLQQAQVQPICDELFPSLAKQTKLLIRAEGTWVSRFTNRVHEHIFRSRRRLWSLIVFGAILVLFFPMPHRLSCNSKLQPTIRRYIASPFEGRLENSFVFPGDLVKSNQLLAKMDDTDLTLELEGAIAEHAREKERHDSALSDGKISEAQIARLEMEKLDYDIDLFRTHLKQLEIRSPVDGIVVSGDLEKAEGAPVETGQTLYEVGPIDSFSAEIEVSERDIRFLRVGQQTEIRFNAFPLETFYGSIERIFPKAEVRNATAVFIVTAQIDNVDFKLKPGMEGTATIETGPSTVAWNLFHRPIENIRSYLGF